MFCSYLWNKVCHCWFAHHTAVQREVWALSPTPAWATRGHEPGFNPLCTPGVAHWAWHAVRPRWILAASTHPRWGKYWISSSLSFLLYKDICNKRSVSVQIQWHVRCKILSCIQHRPLYIISSMRVKFIFSKSYLLCPQYVSADILGNDPDLTKFISWREKMTNG